MINNIEQLQRELTVFIMQGNDEMAVRTQEMIDEALKSSNRVNLNEIVEDKPVNQNHIRIND